MSEVGDVFGKNWEDIGDNTKRLKIFQGWLVKIVIKKLFISTSSLLFIEDPNHYWKIK